MISASGQLHTMQIWRTIWPRIRAYFFRYEQHRNFEETVEEHRELLAALQTRDPAIVGHSSSATSTFPLRRAAKASRA